MMQSYTSDDDSFVFEFVDVEQSDELKSDSAQPRVLAPKFGAILADYPQTVVDISRPGSETPSTMHFPALIANDPNSLAATIPTHITKSQTPLPPEPDPGPPKVVLARAGHLLKLDLPPTELKKPLTPSNTTVNTPTSMNNNEDDLLQKENEPPPEPTKPPGEKANDTPTQAMEIQLESLEYPDVYACKACGTHVSRETEVESKGFQVGEGPFTEAKRGYLFKTAVNLRKGPPRQEHFTTGIYTISYVDCFTCGIRFGWKYLGSEKPAGRAKIGKFCLKCSLLTRNDQPTTT